MNNYWLIYWITRLNNIRDFGGVLCFFGTIGLVVAIVLYYVPPDSEINRETKLEKRRKASRWVLWVAPIMLCIGIILQLFIPTTHEAMFIALGGKTLDYVQADTSLQKIPAQTTKLIESYIEKALKDFEQKETK